MIAICRMINTAKILQNLPQTPFQESSQMAIQWFPGHMNVTKQAISDRIKDIDVVIELLDARLPGSSANPMLAELTSSKPALKVLNKQDLADPAITALWLAHYNALPNTRAIPLGRDRHRPCQSSCQSLQRAGTPAWRHDQATAGADLWHS